MRTVEGRCDDRFAGVREAFARNFEEATEVGAAVAVELHGEPVVDLWGGAADPVGREPWRADTLTLVMSTTKALVATCVLLLWERGELDIDAPVWEVWPEFAARDKRGVTTRHLLTHAAGLPTFDEPVTVEECLRPELAAARLAGQRPRWEPGTAHGYHVHTFGWLLGEIVRRTSGRRVGRYLAEEIATPLGLDTYLGLPPELEPRVSMLQPMNFDQVLAGPLDEKMVSLGTALFDTTSLTFQALANPPLVDVSDFNSPALHQGEWPAVGGLTTARSLARFYGALLAGSLLAPTTLDAATSLQVEGPDRVLIVRTAFGLGFQLPSELCGFAPDGGGFGHDGAGGSVAFGDRRAGVAFAYVMNQMSPSLGYDRRARHLVDAVYRSMENLG